MTRRLDNWTYRAEDRLGGGGYAHAYRCRNAAAPAQAAAIKVFNDHGYVNTFEREVAALETMAGCPGTLELIDHGRDAAGALCIVVTLLPGVRLDKLIRERGPLSGEQTRALIRQMLSVLEFAHGRGLLHKDIKASNILVDGDRYSLLDWGVAEPVGDGRAENIRAKQDFVAPECYAGRHGKATDFYSLGWLIVHATTGALPYHFDSNRERDYRVAAHCLERPELPAALPADWRPLVGNWIGKVPEHRLTGYELDALMASARALPPGDDDARDFRTLGRNTGFLRQAAEAGIPYAQHELAVRLLKESRHDEALFWLGKAAAGGYARSAYRLAMALMETDAARGREWLLKAAQANHPEACYQLAKQLFDSAQTEAALDWLKRAAAGGLRNAHYRYARWLDADAQQSAAALAHYRAEAERGHARAKVRIGGITASPETPPTMPSA
ncbi:MAG: Sel1-like repeat-containing protein kinase family protein [Sulfurisoma sp.]|nr:Sel1-like repeat-containing protein kinase family protein [Sulfurisoma sp.]